MSKATTEIATYESGLNAERHNALANTFNPFVGEVQGLIKTAKTIDVVDASDNASMNAARATRLALRKIRCDVESTRKSLKESALREGKAIDGMANIIKYIIVPVEEDLQEKENYVKRMEDQRIAVLVEERTATLFALGVDSQHFDLGAMDEAAFETLRASSEAGHKARLAAEAAELERIEQERISSEKAEESRRKAELDERKRIEHENAELRKLAKKEAVARAKLDEAKQRAEAESIRLRREQQERERIEKERKAKEERERIEKENNRLRAERDAEQAALAAPDKEKLGLLADSICSLTVPSVSSDTALDAIKRVRSGLNGVVRCIRSAISALEQGDAA